VDGSVVGQLVSQSVVQSSVRNIILDVVLVERVCGFWISYLHQVEQPLLCFGSVLCCALLSSVWRGVVCVEP
jgi:hypothetical protein